MQRPSGPEPAYDSMWNASSAWTVSMVAAVRLIYFKLPGSLILKS